MSNIMLWALSGGLTLIIFLLLWYIRALLTKLLFISNNIGETAIKMIEFSVHLETVYSMETFYGDATLQNLLRHSRDITEELKKFDEIYSLTTEIDEEGDQIDDEEREDEEFYEEN